MKPLLFVFQLFIVAPAILGQPFGLNLTADVSGPAGWPVQTAGPVIGYIIIIGAIGILMAIIGYKLFERCVPGRLSRKIADQKSRRVGG